MLIRPRHFGKFMTGSSKQHSKYFFQHNSHQQVLNETLINVLVFKLLCAARLYQIVVHEFAEQSLEL